MVLFLLLAAAVPLAAEEESRGSPRSAPAWPTVYVAAGAIVLALQSALIVGLLVRRAQRIRLQQALAERLRFETLLSGLSATFVSLPAGDVGPAIESGLQRIVTELDIDRAILAELGPRRELARVTYGWTRIGIGPLPMSVDLHDFPWMGARLGQGQVVHFSSASELPEEAATDRRSVTALGVRSLIAVPLLVGGAIVGSLACSSLRVERAWPDELIQRLRLIAEVFANALARRRAESRIRESEERFRVTADSAPWMVWMSDSDGRRTYFNSGWLDVTGRRLEDEIGDGWVATVHPDDREACLATVREAVRVRWPFTLEYRLQRWDGEHRWILDHGLPRTGTDGGVVGYIGSATDVTEMKTAQQVVAESNALRSAIFGSLYGHVAALDRHGVIVAVNESWLRFAAENGAEAAQVSVGAHYLDVCQRAAAMGDADARRAAAAITAVLEGGSEHGEIEYLCHTPAGARWFEMAVEPLRRPQGGAIISHVDITLRRRAEEEARRQRDELAHALRVTTMGELAGSLAHEINQPLAVIVTSAQAAQHLLDDGRPNRAELRGALTDIANQGKHAAQVIRRLRALFRKADSELQLLDVGELVTGMASLVRHDVERRGIAMTLDCPPRLPPVSGDSIQLQQVVLNLLVNACEAMSIVDGPRDLIVATRERAGRGIEMTISDTGPGLKESELERIFEPFVTTKAAGLGMGLSISRSIIDAHGGRIWVTCNPDRGITAHVELPSEPGPGA
jgi:PAS domain S-box-containing protein